MHPAKILRSDLARARDILEKQLHLREIPPNPPDQLQFRCVQEHCNIRVSAASEESREIIRFAQSGYHHHPLPSHSLLNDFRTAGDAALKFALRELLYAERESSGEEEETDEEIEAERIGQEDTKGSPTSKKRRSAAVEASRLLSDYAQQDAPAKPNEDSEGPSRGRKKRPTTRGGWIEASERGREGGRSSNKPKSQRLSVYPPPAPPQKHHKLSVRNLKREWHYFASFPSREDAEEACDPEFGATCVDHTTRKDGKLLFFTKRCTGNRKTKCPFTLKIVHDAVESLFNIFHSNEHNTPCINFTGAVVRKARRIKDEDFEGALTPPLRSPEKQKEDASSIGAREQLHSATERRETTPSELRKEWRLLGTFSTEEALEEFMERECGDGMVPAPSDTEEAALLNNLILFICEADDCPHQLLLANYSAHHHPSTLLDLRLFASALPHSHATRQTEDTQANNGGSPGIEELSDEETPALYPQIPPEVLRHIDFYIRTLKDADLILPPTMKKDLCEIVLRKWRNGEFTQEA